MEEEVLVWICRGGGIGVDLRRRYWCGSVKEVLVWICRGGIGVDL